MPPPLPLPDSPPFTYASSIPATAVETVVLRHRDRSVKATELRLGRELVGQRVYFATGELAVERSLRSGRAEGLLYTWHTPGVLASVEPWHDGLPHGVATRGSFSGTILGSYLLVHGTGWELRWAETPGSQPELSEAQHLVQGAQHGQSYSFADGQLRGEAQFFHGERHGPERVWNEKGRLVRGYARYWISGDRVRKPAYAKAAAVDSTLPSIFPGDDAPERVFPAEVRAAR